MANHKRHRILPAFALTSAALVLSATTVLGQAAGQLAGKVNAAIPDDVVQRLGQGQEIQLNLSDSVNWEDVVRTLQMGRVRIALLDGSFLNVGARSLMRITKHDPQSQQTAIELSLGKMRAEVVKLSQPGSSFEVKTPTALLGVVGTEFIVETDGQDITTIYVVEGAARVRNVDPNVVGEVIVHTGESTIVRRGMAPELAALVALGELRDRISETRVAPAGMPEGPVSPSALAAATRKPAAAATAATQTLEQPLKAKSHKLLIIGLAVGAGIAVTAVALTRGGNSSTGTSGYGV